MTRQEIIARACHSAWYAYTVLALKEAGEPWETAPEWQRASIMDAVAFWDAKIAEEFVVVAPEARAAIMSDMPYWARNHLPAASHENWLKYKQAEGWVYSPNKDAEAKTHPCMVPYSDLPEAQKVKDLVVLEAYLALRDLVHDVDDGIGQ